MRPAGRVVVVLIALALIAGAGVLTDHRLRAATVHGRQVAVARVTLVCPQVGGSNQSSTRLTVADTGSDPADTTARVSQLQGAAATSRQVPLTPAWTETVSRGGGPVAVTATGADAADVTAAQTSLFDRFARRGLTASPCVSPRASWWLVGADGRVGRQDTLVITNPSAAPATAHVSFLSSQQTPITAPKLATISVPAMGFRSYSIAAVAPDAPDLAIHVQASEGLVTAALDDVESSATQPQGHDWIPASAPPAKTVVIPGLVAGTGHRIITVADPGGAQATVHVRLVTDSGSFVPRGVDLLDVPAAETATVDLTQVLSGRPGTVELTSDRPITAAAQVASTEQGALPDLLWRSGLAPLAAGDTWSAGWTREGRSDLLALTAPEAAARIQLRSQSGGRATIDVPAGRVVTVNAARLLHAPAFGPGFVMVAAETGGPVWAVQTMYMSGAHGPLVAGLPPASRPAPVRVPAVNDDQGIAEQPSQPAS
jgi:hypothetical protein